MAMPPPTWARPMASSQSREAGPAAVVDAQEGAGARRGERKAIRRSGVVGARGRRPGRSPRRGRRAQRRIAAKPPPSADDREPARAGERRDQRPARSMPVGGAVERDRCAVSSPPRPTPTALRARDARRPALMLEDLPVGLTKPSFSYSGMAVGGRDQPRLPASASASSRSISARPRPRPRKPWSTMIMLSGASRAEGRRQGGADNRRAVSATTPRLRAAGQRPVLGPMRPALLAREAPRRRRDGRARSAAKCDLVSASGTSVGPIGRGAARRCCAASGPAAQSARRLDGDPPQEMPRAARPSRRRVREAAARNKLPRRRDTAIFCFRERAICGRLCGVVAA